MAIKLKGSRVIGIICIILLISSILVGGYAILDIRDNWYVLSEKNYTETNGFKNILSDYVSAVTNSYLSYGESDKSEKFNEITQSELKTKRDQYEEKYKIGEDQLNKDKEYGIIPENNLDEDGGSYDYNFWGIYSIRSYSEGMDKLQEVYKVDDDVIRKEILEERRSQYESYQNIINNYKNFQYAIFEDDKVVKSNLEKEYFYNDSFEKLIDSSQFYLILDGSKLGNLFQNMEGNFSDDYFNGYTSMYDNIKTNKLKVALLVPKNLYYDDMIKVISSNFETQHNVYRIKFIVIGLCAFIILASLAYIIKFRKKVFIKSNNDYEKKLTYRLYMKLWLEMKLLLILPIPLLVILAYEYTENFRHGYRDSTALETGILFLVYIVVISILTHRTLIKEIDEKGLKNVIKETSLSYRIYVLIKQLFILKSVGVKISILAISTFIFIIDLMVTSVVINTSHIYDVDALAFTVIGGVYVFLYLSTVGYLGFKFTGYFNKIVLGAHKISQGDLNYQIEGSSIAVLDVLAKDINNMRSGLGNAIQNEVKSERMKTELITNVSHDLKTPLTSIINYVDLIKKGDFTKEEIEDYIKIIDRKSQRLKVLIEDLFEASSAASGEMELNIEKLDIVALLKQSIAEFEEKIKISKLDFRINIPNEKVYVMVDGKRTWRIFENQISNILKYSLDNTRVYINLEESEDRIIIIFKNISAYEIDFNEDEITERFKRGDQSRHTEGSGLGLAISKGLTELQDGIFKIKVDGDLFKVEIQLKKA
ncbi:HAMP domain-containing sensor histidine kinase [Clostridium intestinale]|uniref:HAMP domain-containing sensor histidine kinase n=1 Tax=Clostridium intestinale TaxID=36845 RepID=UPI0028F00E8A|nr:HAMP domain-containing sensor histidine kinase [Clostridium intestinale]